MPSVEAPAFASSSAAKARVVGRVAEDGDVRVVLGGGAQERRAADVDLLDPLREGRGLARDGLLERVEVHHDDVDRPDPVLAGLPHVLAGPTGRRGRRRRGRGAAS